MAILWHEQWHEGLEEASRLYFGDSNVAGMLAILEPLHRRMQEAGPTTLKEIAFVSVSCPASALPSPPSRTCSACLNLPHSWSACLQNVTTSQDLQLTLISEQAA